MVLVLSVKCSVQHLSRRTGHIFNPSSFAPLCLEETVGINHLMVCGSGFLISGDTLVTCCSRSLLLLPGQFSLQSHRNDSPPPSCLPASLRASSEAPPPGPDSQDSFIDLLTSPAFSLYYSVKISRGNILPRVFIHLLAPCLVRLFWWFCFGFGPAIVPSLSLSGLHSSPMGKASSVSHLPGCVENSAQVEGLGLRRSGPCT